MEAISNKLKKNIAIIGAGISNLTFLYSIKTDDDLNVKIFERSKVLSGRAATRIRGDYYFDNGANYFNITNPKVSQIILRELKTDNLVKIDKWIFPFDKDYKINFDENQCREHNTKTKYNYQNGIRNLGEMLFKNSLFTNKIEYSKNITKIKQLENNTWRLFCEEENLGDFDYIVFGVPSPNIARVFLNSEFSPKEKDFFSGITELILNNVYRKIYSLAIAFNKKDLGEEFNKFYALINDDRKNPISWVSIENEKKRIFLENKDQTLLIVQMSDEFSSTYQNYEKEKVLDIILEHLGKLFPSVKNKEIKFYDLKLWGHALPQTKLNQNIINQLAEKNIYAIGDCTVGKGRVEDAIVSGINLYEQLKSAAKF